METQKNTIHRTEILKQDIKDNLNMIIPKDTEIYFIKELINPMTHLKEFIILIDNGTGIKELMPKTIITEGTLNKGLQIK